MDTRVAILSIIVEDTGSVERLNALLHDYGPYIIGRMGLPGYLKLREEKLMFLEDQ